MQPPPVVQPNALGGVTDSFRQELASVLPIWERSGLISRYYSERLNRQYGLVQFKPPEPDELSEPATGPDRATLALRVAFLVGGLLLGFGVMAFIAANWAAISSLGKAAILNTAMLGLYLGGYHLWFKKGMPALGHSLIFAGAIAFGADLGLMAQGFNISLPYYAGYGAWSLGVILLAIVLRSLPLLWLSIAVSSVWLSGGFVQLPLEANFGRFLAAAVAWALAARVGGFRWLYPVSLGAASISCLTFVGGTTDHWGWTIACLLALSAVIGAVSRTLRPIEGQEGLRSVFTSFAWFGLVVAAIVTAIARMGAADRSVSPIEVPAAGWRMGAWLVAGLFSLALVLALPTARRLKLSPQEVRAWIGIGISSAGTMVSALAVLWGVSTAPSATLAILAGLGLAGSMIFLSLGHADSQSYMIGVATLGIFSILSVFYAGMVGHAPWVVFDLAALAALWATIGVLVRPLARAAFSSYGLECAIVAWIIVGATAFFASFHGIWEGYASSGRSVSMYWPDAALMVLATFLAAAVLTVEWTSGAKPSGAASKFPIALAVSGTSLAAAALASLGSAPPMIPTALCIVASAAFGAGVVAVGLSAEQRPFYWMGSAYLTFTVLVRFFEYETSNLTKSVAFILCGAAILSAGAYFERRHRKHEGRHAY